MDIRQGQSLADVDELFQRIVEPHYQKLLRMVRIYERDAEKEIQDEAEDMSHEIRTPLNAIIGFSKFLREENESLPDKVNQYIGNIDVSGQRLLETVNNILDLTKIESGKVVSKEDDVELTTFIQNIYKMNLTQAQEKRIKYQYSVSAGLPRFVRLDREKVSQILNNLVSNAVKYTPEEKSVDIRVELDGKELVLEVIDTGQGIPKEKQMAVFDAFEQVDNTPSRQYEGPGLGLALVKKLTQILNGSISLNSVLGNGSHFTVRLPFIASPISSLPVKSHEDTQFKFFSDLVVLMMEDNPINQAVSEAVFEKLGLKLHMASDGKEGIEKVKKLKPDLILMDIHMPVMDGIETSIHLRQMPEFDVDSHSHLIRRCI